MSTAIAFFLIAAVTIAPLLLSRLFKIQTLSSPPIRPAVKQGETVIRIAHPTTGSAKIELAKAGIAKQRDEQDELRARVIALIQKYPERGAGVLRDWMNNG